MTTHHRKDVKERLVRVLSVSLVVAMALGSFLAVRSAIQNEVADQLAAQYEQTRDAVVDLCDDKANADKPECAETPPPAEDIVDDPPPVVRGPSDAQVGTAVAALLPALVGPGIADYCSGGRCDGKDGKDAQPVTTAQLAQSVADYCAARNECTPPPPQDGQDGTDGAPGQDGREIVDIECDGTTEVYHFNRGDDIRVEDGCPPPPEPTPEPTATP